jgi:putative transposase
MSHAYSAHFVHIVFSTKDRRDLVPLALQTRLVAYLAGIVRKLGLDSLAIGGTSNHVHLLIGLRPTSRLADSVQKIKANSSRWLGEQGASFEWQRGYGAFSVSPSMLAVVTEYIEQQGEHHRKRTFQEEFLALLRKAGVNFEESDVLG